jgi:hypothetical protein
VNETLDYGPRLPGDEYDRKVAELHSGRPPLPSEEEDRELRRRELDLVIDHRLGREFPQARREALFRVQCGLEKGGLASAFRSVLDRMLPALLVRRARALADDTVRAYAGVLSPAELRRFLDLEEGQPVPGLPVDVEHFKR